VPGSKCLDDKNFEAAKKINVFINGDEHTPARQFTVPKSFGNAEGSQGMKALLGMITKALRSEMHFNRPINYLITPYEAKTIKKVSELEEDASYVACHKNRLIQIDYDMIPKKDFKTKNGKKRFIHTTWSKLRADSQIFSEPLTHAQKYQKHYSKELSEIDPKFEDTAPVKVITVYRNGDPSSATKILLTGKMVTENSEAFSLILNHISTKLSKAFANTLRDTEALSVRRIYDLKGNQIKRAASIENGNSYIVCGSNKLKIMRYGKNQIAQPVWARTIRPERTISGRIMFRDEMEDRPEFQSKIPRSKHPYIKLPKLKKRKIEMSDKYKAIVGRRRT